MNLQKTSASIIYWIGLIACIVQGLLGILMQAGMLTAEMCGAIMTAFAIILQWANGNNPNIAGSYAPESDRRSE